MLPGLREHQLSLTRVQNREAAGRQNRLKGSSPVHSPHTWPPGGCWGHIASAHCKQQRHPYSHRSPPSPSLSLFPHPSHREGDDQGYSMGGLQTGAPATNSLPLVHGKVSTEIKRSLEAFIVSDITHTAKHVWWNCLAEQRLVREFPEAAIINDYKPNGIKQQKCVCLCLCE